MTTTRTELERSTRASEMRPVSRALSLSVASGEAVAFPGASSAGKSTAAGSVSASRHHDGGQVYAGGFDPAEQRTAVRHLVVFPARVL
jgi:ABC-type multidrug transport system ATPase subunit